MWSYHLYRVFFALASDAGSGETELTNDIGTADDSSRKGSFGRLRQRMTGGSSKSKSTSASSLKEANTNKHDKSIYGGITMSRFELSWIIHDWWYR